MASKRYLPCNSDRPGRDARPCLRGRTSPTIRLLGQRWRLSKCIGSQLDNIQMGLQVRSLHNTCPWGNRRAKWILPGSTPQSHILLLEMASLFLLDNSSLCDVENPNCSINPGFPCSCFVQECRGCWQKHTLFARPSWNVKSWNVAVVPGWTRGAVGQQFTAGRVTIRACRAREFR